MMVTRTSFRDREDAAHQLAERVLEQLEPTADTIVLGLPRGGVPIARILAQSLGCAMDILNVRKVGLPSNPELAMGAIASGGARYLDQDLIQQLSISNDRLERILTHEQTELERRESAYRRRRAAPSLDGRDVILVDDGLATGSSMRAAIAAARGAGARHLTIAIPVAAGDAIMDLKDEVERIIAVQTPEPFHAVGAWYRRFEQTSDDEVIALLDAAWLEADGATERN